MKKWSVAVCFASALVLGSQAWGQTCPGGTTDPINGQTWVFQASDTLEPDFIVGEGAIGKFTATNGTLTVLESINTTFGGLYSGALVPGKYTINGDCSGGTLWFMFGESAMLFKFVFANNFTEMYILTQQNSPSPSVLWGTAKLQAAPVTCPAMGPLATLDGTTWSFHTYGSVYEGNTGPAVGIIRPTATVDAQGNPVGVLNISESITQVPGSGVFDVPYTPGKYWIYPDCSGGQLSFMFGNMPVIYEFLFVDAGMTEMYMLSDEVSGLNDGFGTPAGPLIGHAKRF